MDMLIVLESLKDRLWIPHQVISEFWRGRQSEEFISYHETKATVAKKGLRDASERAGRALDEWVRNVHVGNKSEITDPMYEELDRVREIFDGIGRMLDAQAVKDGVPGMRDTNTDPVISQLDVLFRGRVGPPNDPERHAVEVATAKERGDNQIPPGYLDFENSKKTEEEAAGDYLLWRQILDRASEKKTDVLFVTRDLKEDWWRKASVKSVRLPRVELIHEFRDVVGKRLFMVEPSVLMQKASTVFRLQSKVESASVAALKSFETIESGGAEGDSPVRGTRYRLAQVPGGRNTDYLEAVWSMARLVDENVAVDDCITAFRKAFPSVTLVPEARRRLLNVVSLGLADIKNQEITLTRAGRKFFESRDSELLSRLFMERIEGAFEVRNAIRNGVRVAELKDVLIAHPELDLSLTQVELLLRWMGKLGLLEK